MNGCDFVDCLLKCLLIFKSLAARREAHPPTIGAMSSYSSYFLLDYLLSVRRIKSVGIF